MDKKTAFIGHRKVYYSDKVKERLEAAIAEQIKNGCKSFIMGTHGEFDSLALSCCRKARDTYPDIEIDVVLTSYHTVEKKDEFDYVPYQDVNTFMYDIEDEHFKRQIIVSNRKMIDDCDTLICYVDKKQNPSGAKTAMNYAKRKGIKIINLFREEDDPTFGMTSEQKSAYWDNFFAKYREPKQ
ncbi:MAG: hypothetical protein II896_01290 [Clostridia bacterium]|nr:hypothetical protein [Clostridia bacterium]